MESIAIHFGLGLLGMFIYSFFSARKYFLPQNIKIFSPRMFITRVWKVWVWVTIMIGLLAITISIVPESGPSLKALTGLDVLETNAGFITLGLGLTGIMKEVFEDTPKNIK